MEVTVKYKDWYGIEFLARSVLKYFMRPSWTSWVPGTISVRIFTKVIEMVSTRN